MTTAYSRALPSVWAEADRVWFEQNPGVYFRLRATCEEELDELAVRGDLMQLKAVEGLRVIQASQHDLNAEFRVVTLSIAPRYVYRIPILKRDGDDEKNIHFANVVSNEIVTADRMLRIARRDLATMALNVSMLPTSCEGCDSRFLTGGIVLIVKSSSCHSALCAKCAQSSFSGPFEGRVFVFIEHDHLCMALSDWPEESRATFIKTVTMLNAARGNSPKMESTLS